jgi:hypothetical protein
MVWRLHAKNESFREAAAKCVMYSTQAEALSAAYNLFIHSSLRKKPVLIEGPDGQRMEQDAIELWCRNHGERR